MALDFTRRSLDVRHVLDVLCDLEGLAVGVKVGLPLTTAIGWSGIRELVCRASHFYWLADYKLADIPEVNLLTLEKLKGLGFDGAILHLFTMGHETLASRAREIGVDLVGTTVMSHRGCLLLEESFERLVSYARAVEIPGLVVGATRPALISRAKELYPEAVLFSPGVGAQGAKPGSAIARGADFEIVGRSITLSEDPVRVAEQIVSAQRRCVRA